MSAGYDEECKTDNSAACEEYANKMKELQTLLNTQSAQLKKIKDLTGEVR